jgi:ATP-binding cassette subfamily C protein LapB
MTQTVANEPSNNGKKKPLVEISPAVEEATYIDGEDAKKHKELASEKKLIEATRLLLREFGIRKSGAAIRDVVDIQHIRLGPREAVSALSNLGFKASFGQIKIKNLIKDFFPLIAFQNDGEAVLVTSPPAENKIAVLEPFSKKNTELSISDFEKNYSNFFLIVKQLNEREKEERSGHWFFSSFRKSKWIYAQVMIAAMVSNFLSLATALFTMTVYDRIIPNGAFDSLIALSIGVIIALGFDFLIRSLRAKFIDTASKRADLEISRRLFERILTLSPNEQRQKNWCDGWYDS